MAAGVSVALATLALVFPHQATAGAVQADALEQARQDARLARQLRSIKQDAAEAARHNASVAKARWVKEEQARREARERAAAKREAEREAKKRAAAKASRNETGRGGGGAARGTSLDGWIRQALRVMRQHGIPGSYGAIHRNIMRESTGNPRAINDWDINAKRGTPSKGLLQVIDPTFKAYHVEGTSWDIYDPVANIVAACNYAAANYGSIDNVNSAY